MEKKLYVRILKIWDFNTNQGENLARNGQEILFDLLDNCLNQLLHFNGFILGADWKQCLVTLGLRQ